LSLMIICLSDFKTKVKSARTCYKAKVFLLK